jgi:outer membrane scaffolding protein for murein synthesis (MipA/OmpV family)
MTRIALSVFALSVLSPMIALADEPGLAPGMLDVQLGAATVYEPSRIASDHYQFFAVPVVELNYEDRFFFSIDDGARYVAYSDGTFKLGPVIELRPFGTDLLLPGHGGSLLSGSLEAGAFGTADVGIGIIEARMRKSLNEYQGWSGDLAFDTGAHVNDWIDVGFEARLAWAGKSFSQEFFSVSPAQSIESGLPTFTSGDYWSSGVEASVGLKLTDRVMWGFKASADRLLGDAADSPRSRSDWDYGVGTSLTYRFSLDLKDH